MSYGKKGYEPGKANSFTPTVNAPWINSFNEMLKEYNESGQLMSRNRLTEKLIEDGLKYNEKLIGGGGVFTLPMDDFDPEHIKVLGSAQGQHMLKSIIKVILGQLSPNSLIIENREVGATLERIEEKNEESTTHSTEKQLELNQNHKTVNPALARARKYRDGLKI